MEEVLYGNPVSKGNLKKIVIYSNRFEAKDFITPKKIFYFNEIDSWSEVQVVQNPGNIQYLRLRLYTGKRDYTILSLHWKNYEDIRNRITLNTKHVDEKPENNGRMIMLFVLCIVALFGVVFLIDYFQTQSLLKNGIRSNALIMGRFFEVNSNNDTSSYSMRLRVVPDTGTNKGGFMNGGLVSAYVNKETFYKYSEGTIVKVVYDPKDKDHAKVIEDIE